MKRAGRDAYHGGMISTNLIGKLPESKKIFDYLPGVLEKGNRKDGGK